MMSVRWLWEAHMQCKWPFGGPGFMFKLVLAPIAAFVEEIKCGGLINSLLRICGIGPSTPKFV